MPLVAAEDTRLTRRLWARYEIKTHLVAYHAQSSPARQAGAARSSCERRNDLALVTDAGTPLVSDPGAELVAAWTERGGRVVPIPGASAVLAALVASGLPAARWTFEGFLPRRGRERRELIARICADERTSVLFEAPGRAAATLADLGAACGEDRRAALCRELTKLHEDVWRGTLGEPGAPRGGRAAARRGDARRRRPRARGTMARRWGWPKVELDVDRLVAEGMSRSSAAREVAARTHLPRRDLFDREPPNKPD